MLCLWLHVSKGQGFTPDFKLNLFQALKKSGEYPCLTLIISHRDNPSRGGVAVLLIFPLSKSSTMRQRAWNGLRLSNLINESVDRASLRLFEEFSELYNGCWASSWNFVASMLSGVVIDRQPLRTFLSWPDRAGRWLSVELYGIWRGKPI